jgi:hypothetical protein
MSANRKDEYLKRAACTIASQLPDDRRDALSVLNYAREILLNLGKSWEVPSAMPGNNVQRIRLVKSNLAASPDSPE